MSFSCKKDRINLTLNLTNSLKSMSSNCKPRSKKTSEKCKNWVFSFDLWKHNLMNKLIWECSLALLLNCISKRFWINNRLLKTLLTQWGRKSSNFNSWQGNLTRRIKNAYEQLCRETSTREIMQSWELNYKIENKAWKKRRKKLLSCSSN